MRLAQFLLPAVLVGAAVSPARADIPGPWVAYTIPVADKYVFVMLGKDRPWDNRKPTDEEKAIREKYHQSGLYPKDDPDNPLWTVDWYAYRPEVWLSGDGIHLVRSSLTPLVSERGHRRTEQDFLDRLREVAITFFANGRQLRAVPVTEIVTHQEDIPHSASRVLWGMSAEPDDAAGTFTVEAVDGTRTVFDFRTGEVVRQERPSSARWKLAGGFLLLAVVAWSAWRWWRRTRPAVAAG